MVPSDGGRFEVSVNGKLIYSKMKTQRHPDAGEVSELLKEYIEESK